MICEGVPRRVDKYEAPDSMVRLEISLCFHIPDTMDSILARSTFILQFSEMFLIARRSNQSLLYLFRDWESITEKVALVDRCCNSS